MSVLGVLISILIGGVLALLLRKKYSNYIDPLVDKLIDKFSKSK
jgi:uncharacterized membrane protein